MAFEIVERLMAVIALVQRLTGRRPELTNAAGMEGAAEWAGNRFFFCKELGIAHLLYRVRWRNAVRPQLFLARFAHPVGRPGRRQYLLDHNMLKPLFQQQHTDAYADHIHGRATAVGRRNGHGYLVVYYFHIAHNAQVNDGQHRHFRISYLFQ
jgi:hypothetical protein